VPERLDIAAEDALQILRVLQESLTNVLKHARAKQVRVEIALARDPVRFVLSVADDGGGFDVTTPSATGRGLSGMRRRAERIGAALEVASDARGTHIALAYPLKSP
jgi:signal transduction histidine kinase